MAKCYLNYISNHRDQVQPLFELLTVVSHKTRCDYTFVKDFYVDLVADKYTVEEKKRVSGVFQLLHVMPNPILSAPSQPLRMCLIVCCSYECTVTVHDMSC